jgi:hypothetical protein
VEILDTWFDSFISTPTGAILMFLLVFLARVAVDQRQWKRRRSDEDRPRKKTT